jgi:hypothetical protein
MPKEKEVVLTRAEAEAFLKMVDEAVKLLHARINKKCEQN